MIFAEGIETVQQKPCFFSGCIKAKIVLVTDTLDMAPSQHAIVVNEGLGWDSLLKMAHNPGGHWHPGRGATPN